MEEQAMSYNSGSGYVLMADPSYNPQHRVIIEPLSSGYTVTVGCQTFAIENVESLISKLSAYLRNPQQVATEWQQSKVLPD